MNALWIETFGDFLDQSNEQVDFVIIGASRRRPGKVVLDFSLDFALLNLNRHASIRQPAAN
jgi:hypothetical protein